MLAERTGRRRGPALSPHAPQPLYPGPERLRAPCPGPAWPRRGAPAGSWRCCGCCCWRAAGSARAQPTSAAGGAGRRGTAEVLRSTGGSEGTGLRSPASVRRGRRLLGVRRAACGKGTASYRQRGRWLCLGGFSSLTLAGKYTAKLSQKLCLFPLRFVVLSFPLN